MNPIQAALLAEAEAAARNPGRFPEGVEYHYYYLDPATGEQRLHVMTYHGVEISDAELKEKFGVPEAECFFCHFGVADIHSATNAARRAFGR